MSLDTMHDLMLNELRDLYSAETQLVKALPKMAEGATNANLRAAFENHLEQTNEHVNRLEQIFESLGESPKGKKCKGMEGLIAEGSEMLQEKGDDTVRDAGLIAAAQRVEHYEIAAYGSTLAFATLMEHTEVAELLETTLNEEKAADAMLSAIGEDEVNSAAPGMDEEDADDEIEDEEDTPSPRAKAGASASAKNGARKQASRRKA